MACSGCGGNKSTGSSQKKMPNWGMGAKTSTSKKSSISGSAGSFGKPSIKMSFSGKNRRGY